jgi:hypothetical protein
MCARSKYEDDGTSTIVRLCDDCAMVGKKTNRELERVLWVCTENPFAQTQRSEEGSVGGVREDVLLFELKEIFGWGWGRFRIMSSHAGSRWRCGVCVCV